MGLSISDFLSKGKKTVIGERKFKEPSIKKTRELQEFYKDANKKNINEFEFYCGFLEQLLIEGDAEKLRTEIYEMPQSQGVKFFFYILEQLGINFSIPPSKKE